MEKSGSDARIIVPASANEAQRLIDESMASRERLFLDERMRVLQAKATPLFMRSGYSEVGAFFDEISKDYDSDLENPYWSFTHEILKFILTKFIGEHFGDNQPLRVFDAGAGTGNWSRFVLGLSQRVSATLFDMNSSMLRIAYSKITKLHSNSARIVEGNLEVPSDYPSEWSNLIMCMHNVIGLGRNTDLILHNLCSFLEDDGLAFIMVTNKYHAFKFVSRFGLEDEALRVVRDGAVKFKPDMPEMFCYTPQEFKEVLHRAGFIHVTVLGFPVTVYPDAQDTKLLRKDTLNEHLKNPKARAAMFNLERVLCLREELAYKGGSSLIAICRKR